MRRRNKRSFVDKDARVDMTPMLDIIFIMLIFFIVTTSFVKDSGFLVDKEELVDSKSKGKSSNMMIHIDENDMIFFNQRPVDIELLSAQIGSFKANHPTTKILVRPHEQTRYQKVVDVLDQIKPFKELIITIGIYKP